MQLTHYKTVPAYSKKCPSPSGKSLFSVFLVLLGNFPGLLGKVVPSLSGNKPFGDKYFEFIKTKSCEI